MRDPETLPLAGVRVADFFWLIAGPATSRMLADLGAEVIKIETNTRDDQIRVQGMWHSDAASSRSPNAVFMDCNASKLSITLNLNTARGVELARELVKSSDIVTIPVPVGGSHMPIRGGFEHVSAQQADGCLELGKVDELSLTGAVAVM